MFVRKILLTLAAMTGALTPAFAQTTTAATASRTVTLPPVGFGSTETAQVNVVNLASSSSSGTAASCTGSISFLNAAGTVIGAATSFTVASGVVSSVSLPFSKAGISGSHGEIRASIDQTLTSGVPCALTYSFETYDTSSGVTHVYFASQGISAGGPGLGFHP